LGGNESVDVVGPGGSGMSRGDGGGGDAIGIGGGGKKIVGAIRLGRTSRLGRN
jgi:hypothetical protein